MVTQVPDSGEERAVPGSQRPEIHRSAQDRPRVRKRWELPGGREEGSERPRLTESPFNSHQIDTGASQEPERSPSPALNTCATRSSRPSCSRTLLGQLPPSERSPSVGPGSARAATGPKPARPLVRASFQKAKLKAPKRPRPYLCTRTPDASEPRLPRETTFQASVASPTPAAPGKAPGGRGTQRLNPP